MKKWVVGLFLLLSSSSVFGQQYDVLIRNGRVVDGMGNPWVYADEGLPVGTHSMLDHRCRSSFSHSHRAVRSLVGRALRRRKAKSPSFSLLQEEIKQMRASSWWSHGQDFHDRSLSRGQKLSRRASEERAYKFFRILRRVCWPLSRGSYFI